MSQFNFTALPEWAITTDEPSPVEDIAFTPMEVLPAETKVEDPEIHPGMTKFVKHVRGQVESAMTLSEKIKRDAFVAQYVIDCNGRAAVQRAFGNEYEYKAAGVRATQLLREPYVKMRIMETIRSLQPHQLVTRSQVFMQMWHEANNLHNAGSVRVAAIAHCGKMLGMEDDQESAKNLKIQVGVMIVPAMDAKTWDAQAQTSQAALALHAVN
jgi:hypothetical protein